MPELPDNNGGEAKRQLGQVEDELVFLRRAAGDEDPLWRMVCFLAHLVVEKSLKAVLVHVEVPFPRTHDLLKLHGLVRDEGRLEALKERSEFVELNRWAVGGRYPGDMPESDEAQARRLIAFANDVVEASRREILGT